MTADPGAGGDSVRGLRSVEVDTAALVASCQELVRIPSLSHQEQAVAIALAELLRALGYDQVEIDDRSNVVARIVGEGDGPTVMFNGHLDHVPPQGMQEPYSAALVDAARWGEPGMAIYGRGASDMKCAVVAAAYAGAAIKRAGIRLAGSYVLTADVAEEVDSPDGIQHLLDRGLRADYGISGESTGLAVCLGHRGKVEFELTVHGRTSHSSNPAAGDNAIVRMTRLIQALDRHKLFSNRHTLGPGSLAIKDITASPGGKFSVVPDRCTIRVDRRFTPDESPESCWRELEGIVAQLRAEDPSFTCDIEQVNVFPPMWIDPDHPLVATAQAARERVMGPPAPPSVWLFAVNAAWMAQAGIPTIGFGPGGERWVHTPEEHVSIADIVTAARIYVEMIQDLCGARQ